MTELEPRGVIELFDLLTNCLSNFRAPVTGTASPETAKTIEYFTAIGTGEIVALGCNKKPGIFFEITITGKRHPVGVQLGLGQSSELIGIRHNKDSC